MSAKKKIEKLTSEQEFELVKFREEALKFGRSIVPVDHFKCENIIGRFYSRIDEPAPKFIYLRSPYECMMYITNNNLRSNFGSNLRSNLRSNLENNLRSNLGSNLESKLESNLRSKLENNLRSNLWSNLWSNLGSNLENNLRSNLENNLFLSYFAGQQWIYWACFYKFCEEIGVTYSKTDSELLNEWFEEGHNLHWWFPFKGVVLISERPIRLSLNERGRLHDENNKAYEYSDGFGAYYLNGVCVPETLVKTPAEDLSVEFFKNEKNADVKAEFVRKYGVERMLDMGTKIDSFENYDNKKHNWWHRSEYELYDMKELFPGLAFQPFLRMLNPTTKIWHLEAVSPNCRTIKDALKERFGGRELEIIESA